MAKEYISFSKHELAKQWLEEEDGEITASIDVPTGVFNEHGDEFIAKLHAYSICDHFVQRRRKNNPSVLHFELVSSEENDGAVDVTKAVHEAQKAKQKSS
ncbi:MAG: hypothetical protein CL760_06035 [Chloroflexi bacterium]|nr:hypothetical protein [Chloroflexota bacterium]|tara:strand:+ start:1078 stop:1377 length:300 start_codon:yes stop_codon:yes gene_type:complete